jgi:pimeloyl-ACP methyl ester carboxylesterase
VQEPWRASWQDDSIMDVREGSMGELPYLAVGSGPPLVVLAGLYPRAGVAPGPLRADHERTAKFFATDAEVFYINRRAGMAPGMTMAEIAAEHAAAIRDAFGGAVNLLGMSTGGSIAQQIAAEHPDVVSRLVLVSTGWRLGPAAKLVQRQVITRVRSGATRQTAAVFAADLVPWDALALPAALVGWLLGPRLFDSEGLSDMATMAEAEDDFDLTRLPTIQAPTLILGGERDRYYGPELFTETAALIPRSRVVIRPRRGHVSVLWSPRSRAEIQGFLNVGVGSEPAQAAAAK